jgi:glycosyltransferase involved in cell wall biosynthesis
MLRKTIKTFNPNIMHAHYASSYGVLGMISMFHPFIVSVWGSDLYFFAEKNPFYQILFRAVIKRSDKVCSTSKAMIKILNEKYNQTEVNLIPFGIDTNKFKPKQNPKNFFTIGTIKSIEDHNGIDCLLDATKILIYNYKIKIKVLIVGSGSMKKEMQQKAALLKIDRHVTFTGFIKHEKVIEYFNKLSIFIAVSTRESFGVAVLEAGALGIPSITSNVGGLTEVNSNNKTGFVINANSPTELAENVLILYKNRELRKEFGENARQRVLENFNWNNNVKKMINLYNDC